MATAHRDAITDVPGIRVGQWTARRSATGCTVVICPPDTRGGVEVRGAAPGTRETDLLRPGNRIDEVHAVLLSGGSAFGLDAAAGVVRLLEERGVGVETGAGPVPIVPAAILFDLAVGTTRRPGPREGYLAASRAHAGRVERGSVGAGTGATVAKFGGPGHSLKGGLGSASERLDNGLIVGALVAVNAVGAVCDPEDGSFVAAPRGTRRGEFQDSLALMRGMPTVRAAPEDPGGDPIANTTIGVVATNGRLSKSGANRLASVAHNGIARAIWPAHTQGDGDAIFALATGELEIGDARTALEALAVRAVERAILDAVRSATGLAGVPSVKEWRRRRR